jgi:NAD-dependent dihydropyrimidine dehydrogenase PreA subunit
MTINVEKCIKCGFCIPYCPMECISEGDDAMVIDNEECVECGACLRNAGCPVDAFESPELGIPRYIRRAFSDPFGKHENTEYKHTGRGTEEIKTNDVTGVVHDLDTVEVAVEMGRPGIGARFSDVETITKAVSKFGVIFDKHNPVTSNLTDTSTGEMDPTILNEKVLSCIIEFAAPADKLLEILDAIKEASVGMKTVFSVCVICMVDENDKTIVETEIVENGYNIRRASSKTNVGLGKPLYEDRIKGGAGK